jgi:hypothetical protein
MLLSSSKSNNDEALKALNISGIPSSVNSFSNSCSLLTSAADSGPEYLARNFSIDLFLCN